MPCECQPKLSAEKHYHRFRLGLSQTYYCSEKCRKEYKRYCLNHFEVNSMNRAKEQQPENEFSGTSDSD